MFDIIKTNNTMGCNEYTPIAHVCPQKKKSLHFSKAEIRGRTERKAGKSAASSRLLQKISGICTRRLCRMGAAGRGRIEITRRMGYNTGNLSLLEGLHEATPFFTQRSTESGAEFYMHHSAGRLFADAAHLFPLRAAIAVPGCGIYLRVGCLRDRTGAL